MALQKSLEFWTVFILGLLYISIECDARAVNVSNTWTMPQEGLNVFYRFFRDRISWFEADAVCQFHHANLVTVDNSFQFDATRYLLRELDVNDIVWIGLMRPQSSERFMWSNSRPLAADTGYWAESLPLMDAPLCAVIDPIRDYRWHALRCGGPETASFLCEMPVPAWADACIIKDMPALTMQYMADTASIELIRNCGTGGLLRQSCRGKEDQEHIMRELICPKERFEAQRINDITNSHFKSLQMINSFPSDNNENNDIELLPLSNSGAQTFSAGTNADYIEPEIQTQTEKNTVQKLIEQFNVDELMQADQAEAANMGSDYSHIPGQIPKPVKKMAKKVETGQPDSAKKDTMQKYAAAQQQQQQKMKKEATLMRLPLEDMMMGDEPAPDSDSHSHEHDHRFEDNETSNEIERPLPHIKKVLPQDLKTIATRNNEKASNVEVTTEQAATSRAASTTTTTTTTTQAPISSTTILSTTTTTAVPSSIEGEDTSTVFAETTTFAPATSTAAAAATSTETAAMLPVATMPPATIGHPMHPQQPRSNIITEETLHAHIKESADNSHFIPPMLLVKSHYVPPTRHEHEHGHEHEQEQHQQQHAHQQHAEQHKIVDAVTSVAESPATHVLSAATHDIGETATATTATTTSTTAAAGTTKVIINSQPNDLLLTTATQVVPETSSITATIDIAATYGKYIASESSEPNAAMAEVKHFNEKKKQHQPKKTAAMTITLATTTTTPLAAATESAKTIKIAVTNAEAMQQQDILASATTEGAAVDIAETTITATTTTEAPTTQPATITTTTVTTVAAAAAATATATKISSAAIMQTTADIRSEIFDADENEKPETLTTDAPATTTTTITATTTIAAANKTIATAITAATTINDAASSSTTTATPTQTTATPTTLEAATPTHNFLQEETETPFKPNRRRSLTKPEVASYFKKILG